MTLSSRLVAVTLLAVVPVALSLGYTYRRERARQLVLVEDRARRSAELLAADTARLLEDVRRELVRLSLVAAVRDGEPEGCNQRLTRTVADGHLFAGILRVDRRGRPVCASHPMAAMGWARQPTSRALARTARFSVGALVEGGNTLGLAVAVPVPDARYRTTLGTLLAAVHPDRLQGLVRGRPAVVGETWAVLDPRGRVLAAWPEGAAVPGRPWAVWDWRDGTSDGVALAGWTSASAFRRTRGHAVAHVAVADGAVVAVWAVSEDVAFADLRAAARNSWLALGFAAVCAAVVVWAASRWLVLRPVEALVRAAERVRSGDLGARTGLAYDGTELGSLASAFDEMVEALRAREAELAAAYDTTLEGWSRALDLRDRETRGHTLRVAALAVELARAMGVPEDQVVHVRRGALLHDIGKMAIPDEILHKPGPLTAEEMAVMRRHPQYAYELLWPIRYLRPALDIPYCHHERWDGSGYPRGLRGEEIPLAARIFAVVDVWDALSNPRPYRPAWPQDKARAYLQEQAGRQFDPEVVAAFLRLLDGQKAEAG
ncbi:MAG: HD-GYP domain-containing protein [Armatimonadota bacterium]|nr:HD-GYP domain-containing protein [Armatimonadota bacterium]